MRKRPRVKDYEDEGIETVRKEKIRRVARVVGRPFQVKFATGIGATYAYRAINPHILRTLNSSPILLKFRGSDFLDVISQNDCPIYRFINMRAIYKPFIPKAGLVKFIGSRSSVSIIWDVLMSRWYLDISDLCCESHSFRNALHDAIKFRIRAFFRAWGQGLRRNLLSNGYGELCYLWIRRNFYLMDTVGIFIYGFGLVILRK